jgi:hypothetical protein
MIAVKTQAPRSPGWRIAWLELVMMVEESLI